MAGKYDGLEALRYFAFDGGRRLVRSGGRTSASAAITTASFTNSLLPIPMQDYEKAMRSSQVNKANYAVVNDEAYLFGSEAERRLRLDTVIDATRYSRESVGVMHAISMAHCIKKSGAVMTVCGYPPSDDEHTDQLLDAVNGTWSVKVGENEERDYSVVEALVMPEPLMAFYNAALNKNGSIGSRKLHDEGALVIDIGHATTDIYGVNSNGEITAIARSRTVGGHTVYSAFRETIKAQYPQFNLEELWNEHIDTAFSTGLLRVSGRSIDVSINIKEAVKPLVNAIQTMYSEYGRGGVSFYNILLAGRGWLMIFKELTGAKMSFDADGFLFVDGNTDGGILNHASVHLPATTREEIQVSSALGAIKWITMMLTENENHVPYLWEILRG